MHKKKYCWDLVQHMNFFYWKKIEGYKNCGFKNNRDPRKHRRMHEL